MAVCDVLGFSLMQMFSCVADERLVAGHSDGQMILKRKEGVLKDELDYQIKRTEGRPDTRKNNLEKSRNKFVFVG